MEAVFKAINLVLRVAVSLEQARQIWAAHEEKLKAIVAEGREPTDQEWDDLFDLVQKQSNELQAQR